MQGIRVLLADNHTLVRAGIRLLLQSLPNMQVVGEASDGREALHLVEKAKPDIVLMDITMPGLNGLEATARILKDFADVRVIMLSVHTTEEYVLQALRAGARGYLLKDSTPAELALAIEAVAKGETYLSPAVSKHVIDYFQRIGDSTGSLERLTPRQREVLQLIAEGRTTQEIAQLLDVSIKTVETHRSELMDRLGIYDIAGLVRFAIRMGVVSPED